MPLLCLRPVEIENKGQSRVDYGCTRGKEDFCATLQSSMDISISLHLLLAAGEAAGCLAQQGHPSSMSWLH